MAEYTVMPGVNTQALRIHSGDLVSYRRSIDRRDCVIFNEIEMPHEFTCTNLVHFTDNEYAASIGLLGTDEPFCFKPKKCWITSTQSFNLTWWSPLPPDDWEDVVEQNLSMPCDDFYEIEIGSSSAFDGPSICGPLGFVTSWVDILKQYAISRQSNLHDIELRVLGTFLYRKEIMYSVLVCKKGDVGVESFPLIPAGGTEAFVPTPSNFIWKVYSTVGFSMNRPLDVDWTWDHLSFGFNCPTSNLNLQPQFCKIIEKRCAPNKPLSRSERYEVRADENMNASEFIVNSLNAKIQRAICRASGTGAI